MEKEATTHTRLTETEKVDKYVRGLPDNIYRNVKSSKTWDETIVLANDLMDQKLCTYVEKSDNKRKADDSSINNHGHQQQPFKKRNVGYNMGVKLGSFDGIIGMDWSRRCHAVTMYDEKLVQIPYENETLTFRGDESNDGRESWLTVISCLKAQEYMAKGCQVFLRLDQWNFRIDLIPRAVPVA
ncbi:hypothetical protein Tco_0595090 [Tanacetum coccineum]